MPVGDRVGRLDPVGGEQGVPEDIAGFHFVREGVGPGDSRGTFHFAAGEHALLNRGPAVGVFEAHEALDPVTLPGQDV